MGPRRVGAQHFALFSLLPPQLSFFLPSLGGSSRGISVVFVVRGPQMCTFGVLGAKKSEILSGPAEGGPAEGCPAEGCRGEGGPGEGGLVLTPTQIPHPHQRNSIFNFLGRV